MKNIFFAAKSIQEKREILKKLSSSLKELKNGGFLESINKGIKAIYSQAGHREFKTFEEWQAAGKRIKRGEHALCLWGKPTQINPENGTTETFFPIVYVFSDIQVH